MGIETDFVDMLDLNKVKAALKPNTAVSWLELALYSILAQFNHVTLKFRWSGLRHRRTQRWSSSILLAWQLWPNSITPTLSLWLTTHSPHPTSRILWDLAQILSCTHWPSIWMAIPTLSWEQLCLIMTTCSIECSSCKTRAVLFHRHSTVSLL